MLVTGGTSGIGAEVVRRLASEGARIVFTGRDPARGASVADETGASFVQADVCDPEAIARSVVEAIEVLGGLDALVLNAGVLHEAPLSETSDEAWDAVMDTNLVAPYRYSVACLPHLRASGGGSIVAISSDAGVWPEVPIGAYSVSKRCLNMLVQMLGMEAGKDGIRVNAVCPGDTAPGMVTTVAGREEFGDTAGLAAAAGRKNRDGCRRRRCRRVLRLARLNLLQRRDPAGRRRDASRRQSEPDPELTYELAGRVALVTGGTSGIGKSCVERLRAEGMTVVFTGRNQERGEAVAEATGATFIPCDSSDRAASDLVVPETLRIGGGRLDVLVANAGIVFGDSIEATPEPVFLELIEVNLTSLFRISRASFEPMRAGGGGSMIHMASDAGIRGVHEIPAYSVTKAGSSQSRSSSRPRARRSGSGRTPSARVTSCRASRQLRRATPTMPRTRRHGRFPHPAGSEPERTWRRSSPGSRPTSRPT